MLYVIIDKEKSDSVMLAKANSREELETRLQLKPTESIVGQFTTSETQTLDSAPFAVISG